MGKYPLDLRAVTEVFNREKNTRKLVSIDQGFYILYRSTLKQIDEEINLAKFENNNEMMANLVETRRKITRRVRLIFNERMRKILRTSIHTTLGTRSRTPDISLFTPREFDLFQAMETMIIRAMEHEVLSCFFRLRLICFKPSNLNSALEKQIPAEEY